MEGELRDFFAAGESELIGTAGEWCRFARRGQAEGDSVSLRAVVGPAPLEYQLEGPGGAIIVLAASALVSKSALASAPAPGDCLVDAAGRVLEVVRVNSASVDASWYLDLKLVRVSPGGSLAGGSAVRGAAGAAVAFG